MKFADIGEGVHEGEILEWHVSVGDTITVEQLLLEVNTEKVNAEITAPVAGKVVSLEFKEGDIVKVGEVLFYCPADPQGLWIMQSVASVLNARDADDMRAGFRTEVFNSRGVHWVDPTGKPERELAAEWRSKADDVENKGYARFAATLRGIAESYDREAERIIDEHKSGE